MDLRIPVPPATVFHVHNPGDIQGCVLAHLGNVFLMPEWKEHCKYKTLTILICRTINIARGFNMIHKLAFT